MRCVGTAALCSLCRQAGSFLLLPVQEKLTFAVCCTPQLPAAWFRQHFFRVAPVSRTSCLQQLREGLRSGRRASAARLAPQEVLDETSGFSASLQAHRLPFPIALVSFASWAACFHPVP